MPNLPVVEKETAPSSAKEMNQSVETTDREDARATILLRVTKKAMLTRIKEFLEDLDQSFDVTNDEKLRKGGTEQLSVPISRGNALHHELGELLSIVKDEISFMESTNPDLGGSSKKLTSEPETESDLAQSTIARLRSKVEVLETHSKEHAGRMRLYSRLVDRLTEKLEQTTWKNRARQAEEACRELQNELEELKAETEHILRPTPEQEEQMFEKHIQQLREETIAERQVILECWNAHDGKELPASKAQTTLSESKGYVVIAVAFLLLQWIAQWIANRY